MSEKDEMEFCGKNHLNIDIIRNIEIFINDLDELFTGLGYKITTQSSTSTSSSSLEIEVFLYYYYNLIYFVE